MQAHMHDVCMVCTSQQLLLSLICHKCYFEERAIVALELLWNDLIAKWVPCRVIMKCSQTVMLGALI